MNHLSQAVEALCQEVGREIPMWTQGAGGNISIKSIDTLVIKASGMRLDGVREGRGLASVNLNDLRARLAEIQVSAESEDAQEAAYADALQGSSLKGDGWGRPSMETGFHALLPGQLVMHFHSLPAVLMAHVRDQNRAAFSAWAQNEGLALAFVEVVMPGLRLSMSLTSASKASFLIAQNHGVIVQGADRTVLEAWKAIEQKFCAKFGMTKLYALAARPLSAIPPSPLRIYFPDTAVFLDRLSKFLKPAGQLPSGEHLYTCPEPGNLDETNLSELWKATCALFETEPALAEVPVEISARIAHLPTERFRRQENRPS